MQHNLPKLDVDTDANVDVIILQSTNNIDVVKKALYQRQYLRYLDDVSCKDLYGLEQIWQSTSSYSPLLSQKDYTAMLGCNRSSLNRHYSALRDTQIKPVKKEVTSADNGESSPFSWQQNTKHIPYLSLEPLSSAPSSDISRDE
ncbi:hypothetical protein J4H70_21615 [Vibrio alginolyticus]|uniref:hypothetical protein n=1 Tax=Vibrio alginolyticus TaxID=663 RepID=UPI001BD67BD0|nr:hypothetical protein [Vibrio alginolyticus]MBS9811351.1 hypothetical protein [Vibrio alginolyticus]